MIWKNNYFRLSRGKAFVCLALFALSFLSPITVLGSGPCVDSAAYGFCIQYHGFPFPTFFITGEVQNMPAGAIIDFFVVQGTIGFLLNLAIIYLLVSSVFFWFFRRQSA
ncbi:MAG: hypothetical protein ABIH41_05505 [Nanoarchaeota archaeon]